MLVTRHRLAHPIPAEWKEKGLWDQVAQDFFWGPCPRGELEWVLKLRTKMEFTFMYWAISTNPQPIEGTQSQVFTEPLPTDSGGGIYFYIISIPPCPSNSYCSDMNSGTQPCSLP